MIKEIKYIKLFYGGDIEKLEDKVNDWVDEGETVRIDDIKLSVIGGAENGGWESFSIMVIYHFEESI